MAASFVLAGGLREQQIGHPGKHDQSVVGRVELSGPLKPPPGRQSSGKPATSLPGLSNAQLVQRLLGEVERTLPRQVCAKTTSERRRAV
jgi:hypothetical protein